MACALATGWLWRTRRTLREERKLLQVLLDSPDIGVVVCSIDGKPTHLNRRAVELMGMDGSAGADPDTWTEQVWPRTPGGGPLALKDLPIVRALRGEVVRGVDLLVKTGRGDLLMSTSA